MRRRVFLVSYSFVQIWNFVYFEAFLNLCEFDTNILTTMTSLRVVRGGILRESDLIM